MVRNLRQPDFATNSSYGRPFRRRLRRGKARSVCLLPFIDDFLFLARSRQLALRLWAEVERVWGRLGLAKHPTKAHPEPTQQLQHLGPDLDLSYGSEFNLFCEFCAQNGRLPDTAGPPLIVRYISWVAARGRNKAGAFGPYLSVINAFFTDNFKEPPALGPFVNQAMRGWELAQQVLDTPDYRLPDDDPGTWTAATISEWVTAAALAVNATPPVGFCWSSHSLRSGGASAASATGVPMPTIHWLGGWKVGSGVVLNYIVPGILDSGRGPLLLRLPGTAAFRCQSFTVTGFHR
eukprot:jgi/Tetstr1/446644/TSEL_034166.t1